MTQLTFTVLKETWVDTWTPGRYSSPEGKIAFEPGREYIVPFVNDEAIDVSSLVLDQLVVLSRDMLMLAQEGRIRVSE